METTEYVYVEERNKTLVAITTVVVAAVIVILSVFAMKMNELEEMKTKEHTLNALVNKDIEGRVHNLVKEEIYKIKNVERIYRKLDKKVVNEDIATIYKAIRSLNGEPELSVEGLDKMVDKIQKKASNSIEIELLSEQEQDDDGIQYE